MKNNQVSNWRYLAVPYPAMPLQEAESRQFDVKELVQVPSIVCKSKECSKLVSKQTRTASMLSELLYTLHSLHHTDEHYWVMLCCLFPLLMCSQMWTIKEASKQHGPPHHASASSTVVAVTLVRERQLLCRESILCVMLLLQVGSLGQVKWTGTTTKATLIALQYTWCVQYNQLLLLHCACLLYLVLFRLWAIWCSSLDGQTTS